MKMKYLVFGSLAFYSYFAKAQDTLSTSDRKRISKTEIEILYNHYLQEGDHSAVTGGIGTEKLTVYSPSVYLKTTLGKNAYALRGGADIISSASTDNIDYVVSSASRLDARTYAQFDYSRTLKNEKTVLSSGAGISIESDYFSRAVRLGIEYQPLNKMRSFFFNVQMYFDDLRWGRLNDDYGKPVELIYPSELRYKEWFDIYNRNTYTFNSGINQVINRRNVVGFFLEVTYQKGLLSTPFHRIYFSDSTLVVENLPQSRIKGAFGLKWNSFFGGRYIMRNRVNAYADDFGIMGASIENESIFKVNPRFSLGPHLRFYIQQGSRYFAPYLEHLPGENFYTSDFDLSDLRTFMMGFSGRYSPNMYLGRKLLFNNLMLRYSYFRRSDHLYAHMVTLSISATYNHSGIKAED
jgi:hypothetical protein